MAARPIRSSQGKKSQDKPKSNIVKLSKASSKPVTMEELLASSGYKILSLRRNQEVKGKVVSISPQELLIDIGAKSEGVISGRELSAVSDIVSKLSVGDQVEASVLYPENDAGQVVLSLRKLSGEKRWQELEEKKENSEDIDVVALEVNKGGVICDYLGIRGFLPASQLAYSAGSGQAKAPAKLSDLIGKNLSVRVIEVDRQTNRLILSQKQPDKKDLGEILKLLSKVEIGEKVSGTVSAVLPFGIFVEVNLDKKDSQQKTEDKGKTKLEGLVHVSEISWEKIEDPTKYFKVGDKADVMVIAKDESSGRLNLSIKQLTKDPFEEVSAKYSKDQNVSGTISRVTPYGVFITLDDGLEGLIHISKIPPNVTYDIGQSVECSVDSIDIKARRIALVPVVHEKPVLYR